MHSGDEGRTTNKRSSHLLTNCENSRSARHSRSSEDEMRPGKKTEPMYGLFGGAVFSDQVFGTNTAPRANPVTRLICWSNSRVPQAGLEEQRLPRLCAVEASTFSKVVGSANLLRISIHYSNINLFILLAAVIT
jgi:hypothetical protein